MGLAVVPALPYLFDHPVEEAVDWAFGTGLRLYGGEDAVRPLPPHARGLSHGHEPNTEVAKEGPVAAAAQLSWEEYKNGRDQARQVRQEQQGGQSWSSWIWPSSGSDEKTKND